MFNLLAATLLGLVLPGTTRGPCDVVPVDRVVAIFAEAGEPVTAGEVAGLDVGGGWCTYEFQDKTGARISMSVEFNSDAGGDFSVCNPWGQSESFRTLEDLADAACSENPPQVDFAVLNFRRGDLAGMVQIIWKRGGVTEVRMKVLESFARAFVGSSGSSPASSPRTPPDACAALPIDGIAAMFADAGEPVKAERGFSFRNGVEISCGYGFTDGTGTTGTILLEVKRLGTGAFTACRSVDVSDATRRLDGVADEACSVSVPYVQMAWVHFHRETLAGEATMIWEREGVSEVRRAVLERFARAWVSSAGF